MPAPGQPAPEKKPREARREKGKSTPVNASPSSRLDSMTRERVDALEADRQRLLAAVERLQAQVDQLSPENSRLREALGDAEWNGALSTIMMVVGGFLVSYATFTGQAAPALANASGVCLLAGILMMLWQFLGRWLRR
jgi:multidrug resistance efflux pump